MTIAVTDPRSGCPPAWPRGGCCGNCRRCCL